MQRGLAERMQALRAEVGIAAAGLVKSTGREAISRLKPLIQMNICRHSAQRNTCGATLPYVRKCEDAKLFNFAHFFEEISRCIFNSWPGRLLRLVNRALLLRPRCVFALV